MSLKKSLKHFIGGPPNFQRALALEAEQLKKALERQKLENIRQAMRNSMPIWHQYQDLYRIEVKENVNPKAIYKGTAEYRSMKTERWTAVQVVFQGEVIFRYAIDQLEDNTLVPFMALSQKYDVVYCILDDVEDHYLQVLKERELVMVAPKKVRNHNSHIRVENIIGQLKIRTTRSMV
ncbi:hypothetical protein BC833DRAFT_624530 [Globomyces pollinis-pini]|nr:hypothetical protein BC833DRAFT_624530 [Globomyces pollinis-pini]